MKTRAITLILSLMALGVFAQVFVPGEIAMLNTNPILDHTGAPAGPAAGGTFQVEMIVGLTAYSISIPVLASISPLNSGFINPPGNGIISFDGTGGTPKLGAIQSIFYQMEAWAGAPTYQAALTTPHALSGISSVTLGTLGPVGSPPAILDLYFPSFSMEPTPSSIPEPTTLALGVMGWGLIPHRRRHCNLMF